MTSDIQGQDQRNRTLQQSYIRDWGEWTEAPPQPQGHRYIKTCQSSI